MMQSRAVRTCISVSRVPPQILYFTFTSLSGVFSFGHSCKTSTNVHYTIDATGCYDRLNVMTTWLLWHSWMHDNLNCMTVWTAYNIVWPWSSCNTWMFLIEWISRVWTDIVWLGETFVSEAIEDENLPGIFVVLYILSTFHTVMKAGLSPRLVLICGVGKSFEYSLWKSLMISSCFTIKWTSLKAWGCESCLTSLS